MADKTSTTPKRHWWQNLFDAYKICKRQYPWITWALLALALIPLALAIVIGIVTGHPIFWPILGLMFAFTLPTVLLSLLTRKAAYAQIEGTPGASAAVIDQLGRGWNFSTEPVRYSRDQDFVWRVVGRPGVVLIAEGPKARVGKLVKQERLSIQRSAGKEVPINTIFIGDGENDTVRLADLEKKLKRLPKTITNDEVAALTSRLDRMRTGDLPIPKGIDPNKIRPSRRAMRG